MEKIPMNLLLMDGKTIHCALTTRRGIVLKIPRINAVKYLKTLPETGSETPRGKACVYILFGTDPENGLSKWAYVGETTDIINRVNNHYQNKDFWNEILIFFRSDKFLNKGTALYAESQLIKSTREAGHYQLQNAPGNSDSPISDSEIYGIEHFVESIKILTSTLGYSIFDAPKVQDKMTPSTPTDWGSSPKFYLKYKDCEATGELSTGGFLIFKGSSVDSELVDSCPKGTVGLRNSLIDNGIIVENRFTKDHEFTSATAAANMITGCSVSGLTQWKLQNGTTLKDYQSAEAAKIVPNPHSDAEETEG